MPEQTRETKESEVQEGAEVTTKQTVATSSSAQSYIKTELIIYWLVGILEAVLAFRVVLSLLGANQGNPFAQLIYGVSAPFVAPFFGLFGYQFQYGIARFEIETVIAMAVYGLIGWGIAKLIRIGRA